MHAFSGTNRYPAAAPCPNPVSGRSAKLLNQTAVQPKLAPAFRRTMPNMVRKSPLGKTLHLLLRIHPQVERDTSPFFIE
jgi:hypothetical protein